MSDEINVLRDALNQENAVEDAHTVVCEAIFGFRALMDMFCVIEDEMPNGMDVYFLMKPIMGRLNDALEIIDNDPSPV